MLPLVSLLLFSQEISGTEVPFLSFYFPLNMQTLGPQYLNTLQLRVDFTLTVYI